ncbi:cystathionine gamma-synthase 1, chloroplastic [Silene latifolia]|uniref:cystathionine gamma-synthase 1, chloroplastic n=1 Tax=Silene latifolia TaxID=37657 RepID=UPI003D7732FE
MAVSSTCFARVLPSVECRREPTFSANLSPDFPGSSRRRSHSSIPTHGSPSGFTGLSSSLILRFPPNFVRQLSTKARRNCSNIGVAQIVAASWTNNNPDFGGVPAVNAVDSAAVLSSSVDDLIIDGAGTASADYNNVNVIVDVDSSNNFDKFRPSFLSSDGSLVVHAGERLGRGIVTDAITTPVVNTSAYSFKTTQELIDFKEGRHTSYEYGRYGNPTSTVLEEKISALEGAESTMLLASGMCASVLMMIALVPNGGHIVTTTDCYRKTRMFIEKTLPRMQIKATVIDPADVEGLKTALDENNVNLFFTESPTNPFLRCVDIKLVSELCHKKGALVCIDGTFSTSLNQKALPLGADLVVHSMTKYMGGHNDVLGGCISGSEKLISKIRYEHHIFGGTLNPNASYLIIRGMKTMHLRVQQQNTTAMRMAEVLEAHPKIKHVYYPGLASHPEHELAKRQMIGFGGVVSFELDGDLETTIKFTDALKIPYIAPSFGGCESIVDPPAIMSYWDLSPSDRLKYGIKDTLIRFSFGVEDFEDLKADILQALESI